jgi:[ribosomal protein S5]-alanine N-acetyltransferase
VTAHTSIRLVEVADAEVIGGHLERDKERLARWEPTRPDGFYDTSYQVERVERLLEMHRQGSTWPGVILADEVVIGQVTISTILRGLLQKGFFGYWVASAYQGHGHASRAVGLALRVMADELGLRRAEAHTQMDNLASHGVLRKNGFTPWGIAHDHIYIDGALRDEIFWEKRLTDSPPAP